MASPSMRRSDRPPSCRGRRTRSSSSPCAAAAARTARSPSSPWPARRRCATRTGCDHGGRTWPRRRKEATATSTFPPWPSTAGPSGRRKDRTVAVIPLASEETLRYQDWVRSRREYVAEKSEGRIGYVHIPDMASSGWAQLHRDLRQAMGCEGVIADVRFNRGGHTSALVAERFADRVVGWNSARSYDRMIPDPEDAP